MAGMLAGLGVTMFYVFAHTGLFYVKGWEYFAMFGGKNFFMGIEPNAFGAIGALVNFAVAYVVSKFTAECPEHIQHMVENVRTPRGAKAVDGTHAH